MFKPRTSRTRCLLDFLCDTCLGVYSDTLERLNQDDPRRSSGATHRAIGGAGNVMCEVASRPCSVDQLLRGTTGALALIRCDRF
jgi:hypothetical protein